MDAAGDSMLIPPFRFAAVETGVYRSAYPTLKNLSFLDTLALRTIVSLTPEPPSADLERYCGIRAVRSVHLRVDRPKDSVVIDDDTCLLVAPPRGRNAVE